MGSIMNIVAYPLGYVLWFVYKYIGNYFVSIFLFTLLVRAATFPLSIKSQKSQADRARLAPRLERIQQKYGKDPQKLREKQMALYEKEGVSMTGGCLPLVVQMVVLFGIIQVIYSPLTNLAKIPTAVIDTSITAVKSEEDEKVNNSKSYYKELNFLRALENTSNEDKVRKAISALDTADLKGKTADEYIIQMKNIGKDFNFFGHSLLENPWNDKGFKGINILWLIPILSWATAFISSWISMRFMKASNAGQEQPGAGCTNNSMLIVMPLFSLYIAFTVPGGVGVYWICSNIIAVAQTVILNKMYNPTKIRAQAEVEYQEMRKQRQEDKKRIAEARAREQAEEAAAQKALNAPKEPNAGKGKKKAEQPKAAETSDEE